MSVTEPSETRTRTVMGPPKPSAVPSQSPSAYAPRDGSAASDSACAAQRLPLIAHQNGHDEQQIHTAHQKLSHFAASFACFTASR